MLFLLQVRDQYNTENYFQGTLTCNIRIDIWMDGQTEGINNVNYMKSISISGYKGNIPHRSFKCTHLFLKIVLAGHLSKP